MTGRRVGDVLETCWRRLGDVWETSGRRLGDVWETSGRCLGDVWETCGRRVPTRQVPYAGHIRGWSQVPPSEIRLSTSFGSSP
eukprot:gene10978-biopygen4087